MPIPFKFRDFTPSQGYSFREYRVFDESSGKPVGRAIVVFKEGEALLYDLQVSGKFRRKGYGSAMLTAMKQEFSLIVTSWFSEGGKKLCIANGFELESGKVPKLVWVK